LRRDAGDDEPAVAGRDLPFTVTARTSEEAIERAIEEHDIPERGRWRSSVQREA
jgi:hypothetical protein